MSASSSVATLYALCDTCIKCIMPSSSPPQTVPQASVSDSDQPCFHLSLAPGFFSAISLGPLSEVRPISKSVHMPTKPTLILTAPELGLMSMLRLLRIAMTSHRVWRHGLWPPSLRSALGLSPEGSLVCAPPSHSSPRMV
jgi:hypothetical protein